MVLRAYGGLTALFFLFGSPSASLVHPAPGGLAVAPPRPQAEAPGAENIGMNAARQPTIGTAGFLLEAPPTLTSCAGAIPKLSHGVQIMLSGSTGDCSLPQTRPYVGVFGNPYDQFFIPNITSLLQADCDPSQGVLRPPPDRLSIAGLPSSACRLDRDDGWIEVYVEAVTEREGQSGAAPFAYSATLHTREDRFPADLELFRRIINAVQPTSVPAPAAE